MTVSSSRQGRRFSTLAWRTVGVALLPLLWCRDRCGRSQRPIPPLDSAVISAWERIDPSIWIHAAFTASRLAIGFVLGTSLGIALALIMARWDQAEAALIPGIQSLRAIPAAAAVPFFLLWFGFSELAGTPWSFSPWRSTSQWRQGRF